MTDDVAADPSTPICPWCSAELPAVAVDACTWCGARLGGDAEAPGLTSLDSETISRLARAPMPQRRSRLLAWITGDEGESTDDAPAAPGSLAPPPPEVRREMLRLELQAEVADLQAEVGSLASDAREAGQVEDAEALAAVAGSASELGGAAAEADPDAGEGRAGL